METEHKHFEEYYGEFEEQGGRRKLVGLNPYYSWTFRRQLQSNSYRILLSDVAQLPPIHYKHIAVTATRKQAELYNQMYKLMLMELADDFNSGNKARTSTKCVLTKYLRLAQVTSGYVPTMETVTYDPDLKCMVESKTPPRAIEGINPKLEACKELVTKIVSDVDEDNADHQPQKVIVWARFKWDIENITTALRTLLQPLEISVDSISGATPSEERSRIVGRFNADDRFRVLVCNQQAAGFNLSLVGSPDCKCTNHIYYSQDFSMINRSQSEKRTIRISGTDVNIRQNYYTLVIPNTIDTYLDAVVTGKRKVADDLLADKELFDGNTDKLDSNFLAGMTMREVTQVLDDMEDYV